MLDALYNIITPYLSSLYNKENDFRLRCGLLVETKGIKTVYKPKGEGSNDYVIIIIIK